MFRFITTAFAATAILASIVATPAAAYAPIPTNHLVALNINAQAMAAANQYSQLGDLQSTRYVRVTVSGLTAPTTITFVSYKLSAAGQPFALRCTARFHNNVPVVLDFGSPINPGNDGMFQAIWPAGTRQTSVSLDIWAVGSRAGITPLGSQSTTNTNTLGDSKWG